MSDFTVLLHTPVHTHTHTHSLTPTHIHCVAEWKEIILLD